MIYYYYIAVILSFINLVCFIYTFEGKKVNCLLLLINLLMLVSNLGYLAKALAQTLPEAVIALKICYIGGCFIPPVLLWAITCIANFKMNHWIPTVSYLFSFFVFALVLTIGYNNVYYKFLDISSFMGTTIIVKKYNWPAFFFYFVMIGNTIPTLLIVFYSLFKKNTVSNKNAKLIVCMEVLNIFLFLVSGKFNHIIEVMPFMYVVDGWIMIYLQRRVMMYNVEDSIHSSMGTQENNSYIIFDINKNYIGSNSKFEQLFPEIVNCGIDFKIKNIPEIEKMYSWIEAFNKDNKKEFPFEKNGQHYNCTVAKVLFKDKLVGNIIEFKDDTDKFNYLRLLSKYNTELENEVREKTKQIYNIQSKLVVGMANMVENRDENTGGHIKRTSGIVKILVDTIIQYDLFMNDEDYFQNIVKAAPMHDLGKITITDTILRKPGRLTPEEFEIMKTHATKSAELVEEILQDAEEKDFVEIAKNVAKHHHERWDGSGYPDKLKGEEIPFEARIMAVADVYDALVSKRCYKEAMSFEDAAKIMLESMGNHFDPKLKEVFLLSQKRLENYYYYEK